MKKKALVLCLVSLFCCMFLVACKQQSQYVGLWKGSHGVYSGIEVKLSEANMNMDIDVKSDGTINVTTGTGEDSESGSGTWEVQEDKLVISSDGDTLTGYLENDMLVINEETSGVALYFTKEAK